MYAQHFGLAAEPFSVTPDPFFLYLSPGHAEALAALKVGLLERRGFMVMTGEVGAGKTTLIYSLLSEIRSEARTSYISNTVLSTEDLLRQALADFRVPCASRDRKELHDALNDFLLRCLNDGVTAALIIDEAQNLDEDTLESIRLLSNYETFTSKLLQIVLVGQPELELRLRQPRVRPLAERIAVRCEVERLSRLESCKYIAHRLDCVGGSLDLVSSGALRLIVGGAQGLPRRLNILCHNAFLFAYGHGARRVESAHARSALRARRARLPVSRRFSWLAGARLLPSSAVRWSSPVLAGAAGVVLGIGTVLSIPWGAAIPSGPSGQVAVQEQVLPGSEAALADTPEIAFSPEQAGDVPPVVAAPDADPPQPAPRPQAAEIARPAAPRRSGGGSQNVRTVRVPRGATLAMLIEQVYGTVTPELLARVQKANPQIRNRDLILAGDRLRFPPAKVEERR